MALKGGEICAACGQEFGGPGGPATCQACRNTAAFRNATPAEVAARQTANTVAKNMQDMRTSIVQAVCFFTF